MDGKRDGGRPRSFIKQIIVNAGVTKLYIYYIYYQKRLTCNNIKNGKNMEDYKTSNLGLNTERENIIL